MIDSTRMFNRLREWRGTAPLIGLILVSLVFVLLLAFPALIEEFSILSSFILTLALVYLYYQQKSILATEHKPDLVIEALREYEPEEENDRTLLIVAISNIGKGQAVDIEATITSNINSDRVPPREYSKRLNRLDFELEEWLQKPSSANYIDAGERKQPFVADFTVELSYGHSDAAMIAAVGEALQDDGDYIDADRLSLKMDVEYQDTLGRAYTEPVFDYVGPFEDDISLTEFFYRGFVRDDYETLNEDLAEGWEDSPVDMSQFDPIDVLEGDVMQVIDEQLAEREDDE